MRTTPQPPADPAEDPRPRRARRRGTLAVVTLAVLAAAVVTLTVFQPQKLLIDERVQEAAPAPAAPGADAAQPEEEGGGEPERQAAAEVLGQGGFRGLDHDAAGQARLLRLPDGQTVLRLEDLDVENGPDLYVYLSAAPADGPSSAHDDEFVNLGRLKGNQGDQNYMLPADVDPAAYRSAVIWCRRFAVGFAAAPLG